MVELNINMKLKSTPMTALEQKEKELKGDKNISPDTIAEQVLRNAKIESSPDVYISYSSQQLSSIRGSIGVEIATTCTCLGSSLQLELNDYDLVSP